MRNSLRQFIKGMTPHNKMKETICIIDGCDRTDMKGYGLCNKHYGKLRLRRKNGQDISNLKDRLPRTKEHIEKQRLQRLGKSHSLKGKTYEDIYGNRAELYRELKSKENSGTWRGGLSFERYGELFNKELKKSIRKRDNFICRECGITEDDLGRRLDIHHIDFNKKNNNDNNLISLCKRCHGNTQKNREQWIDYYKNKMEVLNG